MKQLTILLFVVLLLVFGCDGSITSKANTAYFGGEIINPKGNRIILHNRNTNSIDTLLLDERNRFNKKIEHIESGLYSFGHGGEIQFVILEPNDSILIRLNTYEFDESLVFTGKGAKKNNYLIKTFLNNERASRKLVKYASKEPEDFELFIDTRHKGELEDFENFKSKTELSDFASSIINANIDYHNYADKEIYPFAYYGENKLVHIKDLPEGFYDFRKNTDYNADELGSIFSYNRYLFFHFDNIAVTEFYKNNKFHTKFDRYSLVYNKAKLNLIDSIVSSESIKNRLLRYKTSEFINHSKSQIEINDLMALYSSKTTNKDDIKSLNSLIASLENLQPGKGLPDLKVINANNDEHIIANIVDRPTLIYFWSTNDKKHYKNSHYRIKELKTDFPKMGFMSININDNPENFWKETITQYDFDISSEYRFENPKEAMNTLAVNYLWKVIIVDKNANIIHPNVNIFSEDFENLLKDMVIKKELVFN